MHNTGAGFDYPATTTVMLRKFGDDAVAPMAPGVTPTPVAQGAMAK